LRKKVFKCCINCKQSRLHRAKGLCASCYTNQPKFLHRKIGYEKTSKAILRKKKYYDRKHKEKMDEDLTESEQELDDMKIDTNPQVELVLNVEDENRRSERDRELEEIRRYLCSIRFIEDNFRPPTISQIQSFLRSRKELLRGKQKVKIGALRTTVIANMLHWIEAEKHDLLKNAEPVQVTVIETRIFAK